MHDLHLDPSLCAQEYNHPDWTPETFLAAFEAFDSEIFAAPKLLIRLNRVSKIASCCSTILCHKHDSEAVSRFSHLDKKIALQVWMAKLRQEESESSVAKRMLT